MERLRQVVLALCTTLLATVATAQTSVQRVLTRDATLYAQYFQGSADGCESMFVEVADPRNSESERLVPMPCRLWTEQRP